MAEERGPDGKPFDAYEPTLGIAESKFNHRVGFSS